MYRSDIAADVQLVAALELALRKNYGLNEVNLTAICSGPLSMAWKTEVVKNGHKHVWCTKRHRGKDIARVELELDLAQHWPGQSGLIPKTVPLSSGNLTLSVLDQLFTVHEYVASDQPFDWTINTWDAAQVHAAGSALCLFHAQADLASKQSGKSFERYGGSILPGLYERFVATAARLKEHDSSRNELLLPVDVLPASLKVVLAAVNARSDELQLVHGDYHPGNVLFCGPRVAAIVDLDYVHCESIFYDLGYAVLSFAGRWGKPEECLPHGGFLDGELVSTFLAGYNEQAFKCKYRWPSRPVSFDHIKHHVRLGALLILQWLLEVYMDDSMARPSIDSPMRDCLSIFI